MQLKRFEQARLFCDRTQAYLLCHEAEHNLLLGLQNTLMSHAQQLQVPPYLATVETSTDIVAVALCTPPLNLVLSKTVDVSALALIAQDLQAGGWPVTGVSGLVSESQAFAKVWQALTEQRYRLKMQLWIYQLDQVESVGLAPGTLRVAQLQDRELLRQWSQAFDLEVFGSIQAETERVVERQLQRGGLYLWQDHVPVSMAAGRWSRVGGGRIGPVYTPPSYRCQGYATACVATLSQTLLDHGCRSCYLFTDQKQRTSNHIYQTIGYQVICDWYDYQFDP